MHRVMSYSLLQCHLQHVGTDSSQKKSIFQKLPSSKLIFDSKNPSKCFPKEYPLQPLQYLPTTEGKSLKNNQELSRAILLSSVSFRSQDPFDVVGRYYDHCDAIPHC